ncbi:hypothetical protein [Flavobacterium sp. 9AF]|uniref:hypothetical protein n=1 Tax=Flavobacterium sp. 9AF TaxID=2653142 RepID=UPI00135A4F64|nr:hypothetical protein [Flavobacterium sp. 9AF]
MEILVCMQDYLAVIAVESKSFPNDTFTYKKRATVKKLLFLCSNVIWKRFLESDSAKSFK